MMNGYEGSAFNFYMRQSMEYESSQVTCFPVPDMSLEKRGKKKADT